MAINKEFGEAVLKATTKEGKKLEKGVKKGLDGFALLFANSIKYDELAQAIKENKLELGGK
jgi:hypothetical protein